MTPVGVLVMAYGGPGSLDEVEPYLRDVRGFRETPGHIVEEVRARYARIGGRSPIVERTQAQAAALERALNRNGARFVAVVGMRHWHPYIGDALVRLAERGIGRAVGVVMAPQYSRMSIGAYYREVEDAQSGIEVRGIESWHLLPGFLNALADRVREARARFPESVRDRVPVVYTAHSLPQRILEWQDPYPVQLAETMAAVIERVGSHQTRFAYQSAAMTPDPWLGPDAGDVLEELARDGAPGVVIAPIGFLCEHVEILYDVDIELQERATALGLRLERIAMLDDAPTMIEGLAELVRATASGAGWL